MALGPMFGATWRHDMFEIPYGKCDTQASGDSSEWESVCVSKEPTPSKEPKEPEHMEPQPSARCVAPEPSCVERGLPPRPMRPWSCFPGS